MAVKYRPTTREELQIIVSIETLLHGINADLTCIDLSALLPTGSNKSETNRGIPGFLNLSDDANATLSETSKHTTSLEEQRTNSSEEGNLDAAYLLDFVTKYQPISPVAKTKSKIGLSAANIKMPSLYSTEHVVDKLVSDKVTHEVSCKIGDSSYTVQLCMFNKHCHLKINNSYLSTILISPHNSSENKTMHDKITEYLLTEISGISLSAILSYNAKLNDSERTQPIETTPKFTSCYAVRNLTEKSNEFQALLKWVFSITG